MDVGDEDVVVEDDLDLDDEAEILKDRFRLSAITIAQAQAKRMSMEVAEPVMACIADLAFQFSEQLAKDLELFAEHAGRKSVNVEDVILAGRRNEHLASSLRSFCHDLKGKEPQSNKKRKKSSKKEDGAPSNILDI